MQPQFIMQLTFHPTPISSQAFQNNKEKAYANYLKKLLNDNESFIRQGQPTYLFMSHNSFVELGINYEFSHEEGRNFIERDDIYKIMSDVQTKILTEQIRALKMVVIGNQCKPFTEALKGLVDALASEKWTEENYIENLQITNHFIEEIEKRTLNPQPSFAEVKNSAQDLDYKLNGKPPTSTGVKAAVYAVIGALIGLTLGIVIGGAATFYAGGIGAFPAGVKAAFTGAALGTMLANTGACTLFGCTLGFFKGKREEHKYKLNHPEYEKSQIEQIALGIYGRK